MLCIDVWVCVGFFFALKLKGLRQAFLVENGLEPVQRHQPSDALRHHQAAAGRPGHLLDHHLQEAADLAHQQTTRYYSSSKSNVIYTVIKCMFTHDCSS